jgi:beta-glucosidase-like glycosyl hydrolase
MSTTLQSHLNSLEKKLYQLIISRLDGDSITSEDYQSKIIELVTKGIGGFILFGGRKHEIRAFIDTIQSLSEIPLFIASDIERGVGQQVQDTTPFPCQMAMAAAINRTSPEDVSLLTSALTAIADEAHDVGINMPLVPVLDVNQNPDNPIICTRAFSDKPEEVAWFGSHYIRVLEGSGLISCAKHFPGHGDTATDSHISLPVITKSRRDLMTTDMLPFIKAINTGVSSIMIGHLSIPAIDAKPASLSKMVVSELLRKEIGYNGLILSDALNMKALKDFRDIPIECIKAGIDILLHPVDADVVVKELIAAVDRNTISEEQIEASAHRLVKTKAKLQRIKGLDVDYEKHQRLSSHITETSITLITKKDGILPIQDSKRVHLIFAGENKFHEPSPLRNIFKNVSVLREMKDIKDDIALFAIFTSIAAWKGTSGIDEDEKDRLNECIRQAKHSIVISFGCPYVLRHFKDADILIAAYETTEQAQRAVIRCLKGEMDFKGRLPVTLNISE